MIFLSFFWGGGGLNCDFLSFSRQTQTPLSNSKSVKVTKNVIDKRFENGN